MKKQKRSFGAELRAALSNPKHPEHDSFQKSIQTILLSIEQLPQESLQAIGTWNTMLDKANDDAEKLLSLADTGSIEDFAKLPPINGLTLLAVIAIGDERSRKDARSIMGKSASQHPRPKRQSPDRVNIFGHWKKWQENPKNYPTEADFVRDMQEITGINRGQTIRSWIKAWKSPNALGGNT